MKKAKRSKPQHYRGVTFDPRTLKKLPITPSPIVKNAETLLDIEYLISKIYQRLDRHYNLPLVNVIIRFAGRKDSFPYISEARDHCRKLGGFHLVFKPTHTPNGKRLVVDIAHIRLRRFYAFQHDGYFYRNTPHGEKEVAPAKVINALEEILERLHERPKQRLELPKDIETARWGKPEWMVCRPIRLGEDTSIQEKGHSFHWRKVRKKDRYKLQIMRYTPDATEGIVFRLDAKDDDIRRAVNWLTPYAAGYQLVIPDTDHGIYISETEPGIDTDEDAFSEGLCNLDEGVSSVLGLCAIKRKFFREEVISHIIIDDGTQLTLPFSPDELREALSH